MDFFGRHQRKTFAQIKAHLVAKNALGAGTRAVGFAHAIGKYMAHQVFILGANRARGHGENHYLQNFAILSRPARGGFYRQSTRPGLNTLWGSSACLIARIICKATGDWYFCSAATLSAPMPCSAEKEPPNWATAP